MKATRIIAPIMAIAVGACTPAIDPNGPEVQNAIRSTADAQNGVCPGQVFNFITDTGDNGDHFSATGYARVELRGGPVVSVVARTGKGEGGMEENARVTIPGLRVKSADQCGPYTPAAPPVPAG